MEHIDQASGLAPVCLSKTIFSWLLLLVPYLLIKNVCGANIGERFEPDWIIELSVALGELATQSGRDE
ncbi:MAG: hypothetical protein ABIN80_13770 [Dyadobacter sp.]|uniref:hypothetical protein n=1 Tax=Dyadobacter sp. TaxID=1914288 RepID=UPI003263BA9D